MEEIVLLLFKQAAVVEVRKPAFPVGEKRKHRRVGGPSSIRLFDVAPSSRKWCTRPAFGQDDWGAGENRLKTSENRRESPRISQNLAKSETPTATTANAADADPQTQPPCLPCRSKK